MHNDRSTRLRFGPFLVDLHTHELWKHGTRLKLSGQPFEILAILLAHPGQLATREYLRSQLWPSDTFVDFDHGLNAAMNKLRDALSDSVDSPRYVETLPRRGYRLIASVESMPDSLSERAVAGSAFRGRPGAPGTAADLDSANSETSTPSTPAATSESVPFSHPYFIGAICALALLLAATLLLQKVSFTANRHDSFTAVQRIRPLTNLSDETSEPAFSLRQLRRLRSLQFPP
jgi:DNA-binding winged helix-turn-helix (wHTH) protein